MKIRINRIPENTSFPPHLVLPSPTYPQRINNIAHIFFLPFSPQHRAQLIEQQTKIVRRVDVNVLFEGTTSNKCAFRSVNLKRVVRRNAMAEVGRKSWNRGCIPIVVFGRDKARISISHSPRSSLIPRILTAADLPPSPRRQLLFHSNRPRSRPSPYLSRNRYTTDRYDWKLSVFEHLRSSIA